ncbi:MAG TPA: hypothetical protein VGN37_07835 [Actinocatenispora sp.]
MAACRRRLAVLATVGGMVLAGAVAGTGNAATATVSAAPRAGAGFDDVVRAVVYSGTTIYVGGDFRTAVNGTSRTSRGFVAAVDATTGAVTGWAPAVDGPVTAIAVAGGSVYLGGSFTHVGGAAHRHIAKVSASSGAVDSRFRHTVASPPAAFATGAGRLYAAGSFTTVDNQPRSHVAAFSLATGALDTRFAPTPDGTVHSVAVAGDRVYLGGAYHKVDGASGHPRLAAVTTDTGSLVPGFAATVPYEVHRVAVSGSTVYAALAGPGGRIIAYGSGGAAAWTLTTNGDVYDVTALDGTIYAAGHFDDACTTSRVADVHGTCLDGQQRRQKLLAADASGRLLPWAPQANGVIGVIVLAASPSRHSLAVGGTFTTFGTSTARSRFAQFGPS